MPATATATAAELAATMDKALDLNAAVATPVPATEEEEAEPTPSELKLKELRGELADEILLKDNPGRYVIFPIQHQDVSTLFVCVCWRRRECVGDGGLGCWGARRPRHGYTSPRAPSPTLAFPPCPLHVHGDSIDGLIRLTGLTTHLSRANHHTQIWDMYKQAEASFWTAEELDLAHDKARKKHTHLCPD